MSISRNRLSANIKGRFYRWQYGARELSIVAGCLLGKKPPPPESAPSPPGNVAFVLVGMLGDTIMCLPAVETAREMWPRARISAVVTPRIQEMLSGVDYVDEFLVGTADPLSLSGRTLARRTEERLREKPFDAVFMLGGDQYAPLFYRAGVPIRVGPAPRVYEPLLTHTYPIDDGRAWGPNERLGALRALGLDVPARIPRLAVAPQARAEFRRFEGGASGPHVVIHPFGSTSRQRWPLDRVPRLAEQIYQRTGMRSLLVGGPEFRDAVTFIDNKPSLLNAVGMLSVSQLLAAIESAELVITTDSGPFHMAGALGRPVAGLFRGSRPEHAKRYPRARVILGSDSACNNHCKWDYCQAEPCRQIHAISAEEVLEMLWREKELVEEDGMSLPPSCLMPRV